MTQVAVAGSLSFLLAVAVAAFSMPTVGIAAERGHGAHIHGVSRLSLAVEGNRLELELEAPGADVVGFEHALRTPADAAAIARAADSLKAGKGLFAFPPVAACSLESVRVQSPKSGEESGHTEFRAEYTFRCDRPDALTQIDAAGFFTRFPAAREIEARAITTRGQHAGELTPRAAKLAF